ncbi:MAG: dNTP triphosphohydrolase [Coriobacteriia bacterium]|nr:dNTP triphosphohydrolase [Coriobacteriia bacterium]MCL2537722.1 dNTP triphosphohydrolase [Coriobacteriia bacterium]
MKWSKLLQAQRLSAEEPISHAEKLESRSKFEIDYERIINSVVFRRMQDKTQVFPLDRSDFVRTRMTHSLETAAVAKTLGSLTVRKLKKRHNEGKIALDADDLEAIKAIPDVLSCAGLIHDIGNPPFGHFGEAAIGKWYSTEVGALSLSFTPTAGEAESNLSQVLGSSLKDLEYFDGNGQALRVLTKIHVETHGYGLNLTAPVLGSMIKYPTSAHDVVSQQSKKRTSTNKKMGYTAADADRFDAIVQLTGSRDYRHPLAFLLEAADDIAYRTADIEDAFEKGLFSVDALIEFFNEGIERYQGKSDDGCVYTTHVLETLMSLRSRLSGHASSIDFDTDLHVMRTWINYLRSILINSVSYCFNNNYRKIMCGSYPGDLFEGTFHEYTMKILGEFARKKIYPSRDLIKLELAAATILSGLLDRFVPAVLYRQFDDGSDVYSAGFTDVDSYSRLYALIPKSYKSAYERDLDAFRAAGHDARQVREYDLYLRLIMVADFISGMTDSYAKTLYQEISGMHDYVSSY